jgi:PAS domain S-box-containing protein
MTAEPSFRKLGRWVSLGFALSVLLVLLLGIISMLALRASVASDRQAFAEASEIIEFGRLRTVLERKMKAFRSYLGGIQQSDVIELAAARHELLRILDNARKSARGDEIALLDRVAAAEQAHHEAVDDAVKQRRSGASQDEVAAYALREIGPRRGALEASIDRYLASQRASLRDVARRSQKQNALASDLILIVALLAATVVAALAVVLTRRLSRSFETERRERQRAETTGVALSESQERKAAILASSLDAVVTIDEEGRVLEFNPAAEKMFGYTAEDVVGQEMASLIIPERFREPHRDGLAHYRGTGKGPIFGQRIEMPALRRDGSEFPMELTVRPIRTGRETFFTGFIRDISERKSSEQERAKLLVREREARARAEAAESRATFLAEASELLGSSLEYKTTLSSVAALAVPRIADWCFVDIVEEGAFRRLAVSHLSEEHRELARELEHRHLLKPDAPEGPPQVLRTGRADLRAEVSPDFLRVIARTEADYEVLARMGIQSLMCVPMQARHQPVGLLTLISTQAERRYSAEDLALAEELARRAGVAIDNARLYRDARDAVRLRDEFLSIASHELKTPITTLGLQVQSLTRSGEAAVQGGNLDKFRSRVATAERQVNRLSRLVDSLLDISRITGGRLDLEGEPVDLAAVARDALARAAEELDRAGCTATLRLEGPSHIGQWDRTRLEQILANLLSNAAKYGAGRPVEVTVTSDAETSRLAVADHGIGIAPEHQARIFDRFERAVSVRHYGGLGLGLWIVRQIVEGHGGSITVASTPGEGSVFTVELPKQTRAASSEQPLTDPAEADG